MNVYPGGEMPAPKPPKIGLKLASRFVKDVPKAFGDVALFGQANHIDLHETFDDADETRYKILVGNHFQGLARHQNGQHFYISGDDPTVGSHLFILKAETYLDWDAPAGAKTGPIFSNLITKKNSAVEDKLVDLFVIDKKLDHAGGISMMGNVLVVALESKKHKDSKIAFIDVSRPETPEPLKVSIPVINDKAGSASAIRLKNGRVLCASWTENGGPHLNFYLSKDKGLTEFGDVIRVDHIDGDVPMKEGQIHLRFQSMNFVRDQNDQLYLIGLDGEKKTGGKGRWHLLSVDLPDGFFDEGTDVKPEVEFERTRFPHKGYSYYNFNSCGGIYVDPNNRLAIYGGSNSRGGQKGKTFKLCEFYPRLNRRSGNVVDVKKGIVELYTETHLKGRSLVIPVGKEKEIPNFHDVKVPGPLLNQTVDDKFRSVAYFLPDGEEYNLYHDKEFKPQPNPDGSPNKKILNLKGNGGVQHILDLNEHLATPNIKISSGRLEK